MNGCKLRVRILTRLLGIAGSLKYAKHESPRVALCEVGVFVYSEISCAISYTIYRMNREKYLNLASKVIIFVFVIYTLFLLGKSLFINYELRQSIQKLNEQIATLEQQKKDLNNLILYYQSDSFKELEARRKLGLKKPGEKVYLISATTSAPMNFEEEMKEEQEKVSSKEKILNKSNWSLWWDFFTK